MMRAVATVAGVGLLRPAPGTWGSAVAVAAGVVIDRFLGFPGLLVATLVVTALGFWACAGVCGPGEDPSEVVIDEVAGQWVALMFPSFAFWMRDFDGWMPYPGWVAAFLLFRLFDIWKPGPVGWADRRGDAAGVMLDDLIAGVFAGIGVVIAAGVAHGLLMG
ncbi:phosphatidylglycerophosphatase A family protein [Paragemmobacter ruber]|uniref:Phosphatidylglycerophosphatase A n=1 Tax=Paragemmobacter ruber TaxID=1985673 RepID=A0ABW9Y7P9_9RHOB|nr:phosphatidylglycerophosphatase A [Rhodobacter ruber]NBE08611.1 phosphatidylglycerophosphatase A [Rhodobacter ruber]